MKDTREIFGRNEESEYDEIQKERRMWEEEITDIISDDLFAYTTKEDKERIKDYEKRGII